MKVKLTQDYARNPTTEDGEALESGDVYDTVQPRLILRVRKSGNHSYCANLGRGRWYTLGPAKILTPAAARDEAKKVLGKAASGGDPIADRRRAKVATLDAFLDNEYEKWALAHLKSGADFVARIRRSFSTSFGAKPLNEITPAAIERWCSGRLRGDKPVKSATVNRDLVALKACLSKAVLWGIINEHPIRVVRRRKEDDRQKPRFLATEEEQRLRDALKKRDDERCAERRRANAWRQERGYALYPEFGAYTDHLTPIVLLALNTGLRRGELLQLRWSDVTLTQPSLTVRGEGAKSGRTRHVPLNAEALAVLKTWGPLESGLVFPGDGDKPIKKLRNSWANIAKAAELKNFRFHDLRHTFASRILQRGGNLADVRALLGHSDYKLTLRYAHLAQDNLKVAVDRLNPSDDAERSSQADSNKSAKRPVASRATV